MNSSYDHFLHDEKSDNMLICFIFRLDFYQLKYKICEHCIKNKNKETNLKYIYIYLFIYFLLFNLCHLDFNVFSFFFLLLPI